MAACFQWQAAVVHPRFGVAVGVVPDAPQLHQDGLAKLLWRANRGTLEESRVVVADDLNAWQSFDVALAEFEADLLLAESYGAPHPATLGEGSSPASAAS